MLKKGFTLIELLVVVLIIGILAAVALPQYQRATEKAKAAEALTMIRTLKESMDRYYLTTGAWPKQWDQIDISFPSGFRLISVFGTPTMRGNDFEYRLAGVDQGTGRIGGVYIERLPSSKKYMFSLAFYNDGSSKFLCTVRTNSYDYICQSFGV
jgi:prepilin-type N-terminal cleavage/methylation domain-containing protein